MYEPLMNQSLLHLLQLASPSLPVGAYSYSEGLETLVNAGTLTDATTLGDWLTQELRCGSIRLEVAAIAHVHQALIDQDVDAIARWNRWLSAIRDAEELREQSWQMGQALVRLMSQLEPELVEVFEQVGVPCNVAIAFGVAASHWQIDREATLLGYLHSWVGNLVNAGIKLIPLGQTAGQALLLTLYPTLQQTVHESTTISEDELSSCSWGVAIASMQHETLYSRLFRS